MGPNPREARRRIALRSIAEGLQHISAGLLALAQDEVEDVDADVRQAPRRRAWRSPSKPKAPLPTELAAVTEDSSRKAELALRKRGLL
jgi:hypothetical protein